MAQLVKLQDYISRYETALTRYPTQFVRLKQIQWERVKTQWISGEELPDWEHIETEAEIEEPKERFTFLKKLMFKRSEAEEENIEEVDVENELIDKDEVIPEDETTTLFFEPKIVYHPQTLEELKVMFLDQFFHFQIKWASSTLREKSYVDPKFLRDTLLRNILQQLPDSYLIFYYPIIKVKKAPVELDVVILTPTECICITVVEHDNMAVYVGNSERFWTKKVGKIDKKMLNPLIQLNRMEAVVSQIFTAHEVDLPIRKVLLSRNGYFDYPGSIYNVQFIDKREFPKWLMHLKRSSSPMKRMQMHAAQAILHQVQTTSFNRDIWNVENIEE
ncbi:nuclease-like protein [Ureibacillus xyleni]|uniref:Nuclease-like protein n=1 Tax=Ureibacillus xyleni TaxID=614648 RepID=A0A285S825_9BACL|nr:nuclease-related domain-containing protein [Ureibacillus xyleni]SOC03441.1 nuclease-like protein [Ureibacillus xyleni]